MTREPALPQNPSWTCENGRGTEPLAVASGYFLEVYPVATATGSVAALFRRLLRQSPLNRFVQFIGVRRASGPCLRAGS